jgi:hypothetical protein
MHPNDNGSTAAPGSRLCRSWRPRFRCPNRAMRLTTMAVIGALALAAAGPGTANAAETEYDLFHFARMNTGTLVLDVPNHSTAWAQPLQLWERNYGDNQLWDIENRYQEAGTGTFTGGGYTSYPYVIINRGNGLCVDAPGLQPAVDSMVQQYPCDPNFRNQPNQLWYILLVKQTDGSFADYFASGARGKNFRLDSTTHDIEAQGTDGSWRPALVMEYRPGDRRIILSEGNTGNLLSSVWREQYTPPTPPPAPAPAPPQCVGVACLVNPN